jgi:oligosaccharide repeat unit polymerase
MEVYAYITLLILIVGFFLQFKFYGAKYFLHPSFWFFAIWILSVISFIIYISVGLTFIIFDRSLLEELFVYLSFTALCVLIVSVFSYKKIRSKPVSWTPKFSEDHFKAISTFILLVTVVFFIIGSGFDMVKNREQLINSERAIALQGGNLPFLQMVYNIILGINLPMLILSGFYIGKIYYNRYVKKSKGKFDKYYFYPSIVAILGTISMGGRAGIFTSLLFLTMGILLALLKYRDVTTKLLSRFLKYGIVIFILFSVFITYVNIIREGGNANYVQSVVRWNEYPALQPFSGLLQYLTDHYPGYQLRRIDSTPVKPRLGQTSLSGITMFSIPVLSQLMGTPISIQNAFKLDAPNTVLRSQERKKAGAMWVNTTATVYFNLYEDFGYVGTFIVIFIFVIISQITFNSVFLKKRVSFLAILPLTITYFLWSQSIFSHVIIGNWTTAFIYPFILADIIGSYKKSSSKREKIYV